MVEDETDLSVDAPGLPLVWSRSYNSVSAYTNSPAGRDWTHAYDWSLTRDRVNDTVSIREGDGTTVQCIRYGSPSYWRATVDADCKVWEQTNGTYRLEFFGANTLAFTSNGVLTSVTDPVSNRLTLTYSGSHPNHRLTRIEHNNGQYLAFTYTGGRISRADTPSADLYATYAYSPQGDLTAAIVHTPAKSYTTTYAYDTVTHSLTQRVNAAGEVFSHAYSDAGRCTNMVLGAEYYRHSVEYLTNVWQTSGHWEYYDPEWQDTGEYWVDTSGYVPSTHAQVTYRRGSTNQLYDIFYDTNTMRVTKTVGPSTNVFTEFTYGTTFLDLTEEKTTDKSVTPNEYLRKVHSYDNHHGVLTESRGYCGAPAYTWNYQWDANGNLTNILDPQGVKTGFDYAGSLPVRTKLYYTSSNSFDTLYVYNADGLLSAVTNANSHWIHYTYDAYGHVSSVNPQTGPSAAFEWSRLGVLERITLPGDPARVTEFDADTLELVSRITYPDSTAETFAYDAMRHLTNRVDAAGRATRLAYAPAGHLASVTRMLEEGGSNVAVTVSTEYDNQFNTLVIRDPLNRVAEAYALDLQDRPVAVTNLEGQVMRVNYGLGSFVRSVTRFDGTTVSNTFDTGGRLTRIRYPDSSSAFSYLANDSLSSASNATCRLSFAYDLCGRLTNAVSSVRDAWIVSGEWVWDYWDETYYWTDTSHYEQVPLGSVRYAWYPAGQVSNVASVAGSDTWSLDAADRPETLTAIRPGLDAATYAFAYNETNGQPASLSCPNGLTCSYAYDTLDRMTGITWRDASNRVVLSRNYAHSAVGLATRADAEDGGRTEYDYDGLDRLAGERVYDAAGGLLSDTRYAYDLAGNRTGKTLIDGSSNVLAAVRYTLGDGDRLAAWSADLSRTALTLTVSGTANEPIGTDDAFGYLWVSNATAGGAAVVPSVSGSNFWAELTVPAPGPQTIVTAVRDAAGNTAYATNVYTAAAVTNGLYAYDAAGCLTNVAYLGTDGRTDTALRWDGAYRLTEVRTNGAAILRNGYDALGRRVWTWDGAETNFFVYDGIHVVAETDATGGLRRAYTRAPGTDRWLAMTVHTGATVRAYTYLTDRLGTVCALADESGSIVESYAYDAWGRVAVLSSDLRPLTSSRFGNRLLFQGREYDWATGFYYFRARWYDPVTGRWLSKDPIGISGGLNQYAFCGDDPVNSSDPWGLCEGNRHMNGELEAQKYVDLLQRDKWKLLALLVKGDVPEIYAWSTQDGKDLAAFRNAVYLYRGYELNGPQQGNVDAAYAFTRVFKTPVAGIAVSVGGEAAGYLSRVSTWDDAKGSFEANWIGIKEASKDNLVDFGIHCLIGNFLPF